MLKKKPTKRSETVSRSSRVARKGCPSREEALTFIGGAYRMPKLVAPLPLSLQFQDVFGLHMMRGLDACSSQQ